MSVGAQCEAKSLWVLGSIEDMSGCQRLFLWYSVDY